MDYKHKVVIPKNKSDEIIAILKSFNVGDEIKKWTDKHYEDGISTWLRQNTINEYHWLFVSGCLCILFNVIEDATAFKLRWL